VLIVKYNKLASLFKPKIDVGDFVMERRLFEQSIDVILEDIDFSNVSAAADHVDSCKAATEDAERSLQKQIDLLNSNLAVEIRHHEPRLKVTLDRHGNCKVGYRNYPNFIVLRADPKNECFKCGSTPFERRFIRYHGQALEAPEFLGEAIAKFFKQQYRSMR
jgi:D-ribose pyranose/furanose isomerase RbsD